MEFFNVIVETARSSECKQFYLSQFPPFPGSKSPVGEIKRRFRRSRHGQLHGKRRGQQTEIERNEKPVIFPAPSQYPLR